MLSDSPQHQSALPRSRIVEVIAQGQEDIVRQLRAAGIPETEALAVIRRFSIFSVQVLRELDLLYREYEELRAQDPDRSQAHQEWLDTKVAGMLLTIEAFVAAMVAEAITKAKEDYRNERSRPREVLAMPSRPPVWEQALHVVGRQLRDPLVLWSVGLTAWFLVWYFAIGSLIAGFIAMIITAVVVYFLEKPGLVFILTAGGMFLLLLVL